MVHGVSSRATVAEYKIRKQVRATLQIALGNI